MAKLFEPIRIGALNLTHRVVLAPLTRMRSEMPGNVPAMRWSNIMRSARHAAAS